MRLYYCKYYNLQSYWLLRLFGGGKILKRFSSAAMAEITHLDDGDFRIPIVKTFEEIMSGAVMLDAQHRCTVRLHDGRATHISHILVEIINDYDGVQDVVYDSYRFPRTGDDAIHELLWTDTDTQQCLQPPPQPPIMPPELFVALDLNHRKVACSRVPASASLFERGFIDLVTIT